MKTKKSNKRKQKSAEEILKEVDELLKNSKLPTYNEPKEMPAKQL